jgi:2-deoxy-D-gluconate 3-dehydrogenase
VTGAARGIGLGIARRLAEAGASVLLADNDGESAQTASNALAKDGMTVSAIEVNVASESEVEDMVTACLSEFGTIDILVNNAGVYPNEQLLEMSLASFEAVVSVNLTGVFLCTRIAARAMVDGGRGGRVINITSVNALKPTMKGLAHYDSSKHGAWGFTKSAALELAPYDILVNAVACGGVMTPGVEQTLTPPNAPGDVDRRKVLAEFLDSLPMRRMGEPEDIARAVLFLASPLASYITGTQLLVDGGLMLM